MVPDPGNSDEHGSELRSDANGGLTAVELNAADLDTDADLESFEDLDADDADLQAALAGGDLEDADVIVDVAEVVEELACDDVEVPEGPDAAEEPDQPSAEAGTLKPRPRVRQAPASLRIAPDGGGEDEEIFVFGDDDDDLPAAQVAVAGATADPVKDYLKQIGKVPLLNAEQEVELAERIEAGLFAEEKLAEGRRTLNTDARIDLEWIAEDGTRAKNHLLEANLLAWWCRWPSVGSPLVSPTPSRPRWPM